MKRALALFVTGFAVAALASRALERAGVYRCGCYDDCWCKHPGLSLFRWMVPRWHRGPWLEEKERLGA